MTVQYSTPQYTARYTAQYNTVPRSTPPDTVQYTTQYSTVQYSTQNTVQSLWLATSAQDDLLPAEAALQLPHPGPGVLHAHAHAPRHRAQRHAETRVCHVISGQPRPRLLQIIIYYNETYCNAPSVIIIIVRNKNTSTIYCRSP